MAEKSKAKAGLAAMKKREDKLVADLLDDSDDNFSFIAGYTTNGTPYGITWEETDD